MTGPKNTGNEQGQRDKCPKCGSENIAMNAMFDIGDYEIYTCQNCYHRFGNPDEAEGEQS